MAYSEVPAADLVVGKPVKKSLMTNINDNLKDHESRISALASGANKVVLFDYFVDFADQNIGEIRSTDMTLTEFQQQNGTEWVLCDGQNVSGSFYAGLTGHTVVPNLVDEFLRGAGAKALGSSNADSTAVNGLSASTGSAGAHTHTYPGFGGDTILGPSQTTSNTATQNTSSAGNHSHTVSLTGDSETAPQHYAVNFFIKVNPNLKNVLKVKENMSINNVKGYIIDMNGLPTSGNFEFDILKSSTTRASLTTIFATKPTLAYAATADGDATSSGTFLAGGATLVAGDWLDLEVTSLMVKTTGIMIQIFGEVS